MKCWSGMANFPCIYFNHGIKIRKFIVPRVTRILVLITYIERFPDFANNHKNVIEHFTIWMQFKTAHKKPTWYDFTRHMFLDLLLWGKLFCKFLKVLISERQHIAFHLFGFLFWSKNYHFINFFYKFFK